MHRSWLGFYLATQNDGFFPEWTFPANTFIFRHNCSSVPPNERALRKRCLWKGPSPEFSRNLQRGAELLGFFAVLLLHVSSPSSHCCQGEDLVFSDSSNLSKAQAEGPRGALTAMNGAPRALCPSSRYEHGKLTPWVMEDGKNTTNNLSTWPCESQLAVTITKLAP